MVKLIKKLKFALILVLFAIFSLSALVLVIDKSGQSANANTNGNKIELGANENGFNTEGLKQLFNAISGKDKTDYSTLKNGLNIKNAQQINSYVTLGGYNWNVVYASVADGGDVIATLWLAESSFKANWSYGWCSDYSGVGVSSNVKYPCNYYSTSYIRSFLTGSVYAYVDGADLVNTNGAVGNVVTHLSAKGEQNEELAAFLNSYSKYIVTPSKVNWQRTERAKDYISSYTTYDIPNESAANIPNANWAANIKGAARGTMNYTAIGSAGNGTSGSGTDYTAWANDFLWIPSLTETGFGNEGGMWNLNSDIRKASSYTWVRSATYNDSSQTRNLNSVGINSGGGPRYSQVCRPAFHLNLNKAAKAAGLIVESTWASEQAEGIILENSDTVAVAVFNNTEQAVKLSAPSAALKQVVVTSDGNAQALTANDKNLIKEKNAGTYTVTEELAEGYCWLDETTALKTVIFKITPKIIEEIIWNIPTTIVYDGTDKLKQIEAYFVNLEGKQVALEPVCVEGFDGISAGTQEITAQISDSNYEISEENTQNSVKEFLIEKAQIRLTWNVKPQYYYSGTKQQPEVTAETDNYDGKLTFAIVITNLNTGKTVTEAVDMGKYKIEVTLVNSASNYNFDKTPYVEFEILALPDSITIHWVGTEFTYNGKVNMPTAYYTVDGGNGAEFPIDVKLKDGSDGIKLGTHTAQALIDVSNFQQISGDLQKEFEITAVRISIGWIVSDYVYDGGTHMPQAYYTVLNDSNKYRLEVKLSDGYDGVAIGSQQAEVVEIPYGYSLYSESDEETAMQMTCGYIIYKKVLTVVWDANGNYTYNGSAQSPVAKVEDEEENILYSYSTADGVTVDQTVNADDYIVKVSADDEFIALRPDCYEYTINRATLNKPYATVAEFDNLNAAEKYLPTGYDPNTMILSGFEQNGKYVICVKLKDNANYVWNDGEVTDVNFFFDLIHSDIGVVEQNGSINWIIVSILIALGVVTVIAVTALIVALSRRNKSDENYGDNDGFYEPYLG